MKVKDKNIPKKTHQNKYAHLVSKRDKSYLDEFTPDATLDYHDRGSMSKYKIEKLLEDFLIESYSEGLKKLLVITGQGKVVRPIVRRFLDKSDYIEKFKKAGYFNGQSGAFEVSLKTS
jgi:DNA-nicking Smr family endonuclease